MTFEFFNPTFNRNILPSLDVERIDSPNGRKYRTPDGNLYESVTTFLGRKSDFDVESWKNTIGVEKATKIGRRAATRGTSLHYNCELYLQNTKVVIPKTSLLDYSCFKQLVPILDRIDNIKLQESMLYSDVMRLAGTIDLLADFDGVPTIIDFKTSSNIKSKDDISNYWLQATIYSLMVEEQYDLKIPNLAIIISNEFAKPSVFTSTRKQYIRQLGEMIAEDRRASRET